MENIIRSTKFNVFMFLLGLSVVVSCVLYFIYNYIRSIVLHGGLWHLNLADGLMMGVGSFILMRLIDRFAESYKKIADLVWCLFSLAGLLLLISSIDRFHKLDMKQVLQGMKDNHIYIYGFLITTTIFAAATRIAVACSAFFPKKR